MCKSLQEQYCFPQHPILVAFEIHKGFTVNRTKAEAFLGVSSLEEGDLIKQTTLYATNYCPSAPE